MKHRYFAVVVAALSLSACATLLDAPPMEAAPAYYDALGTEPFWSLEAYDNIMSFNGGDEQITRVMEYRATSTLNGWRYVSKNVTADVTFTPCSDGMSDRTYKDTVTVTRGKETFKGCGGGILPPASLEHTVWRVASINGAETPASQGEPLRFGDGRMSGTVGCNRLSADYIYAGGKLSFGPVMSTRMACEDPLAFLELAFVSLLGSIPSTTFTNTGAMVLSGKGGTSVTLEQSI